VNKIASVPLINGNNNNSDVINFDANPDLNCVVIDALDNNRTLWQPASFFWYCNHDNTNHLYL